MTAQVASSSALAGFSPVVSLMHKIKDSGREHPRVRLAFAGKDLVLTVAGEKSKTPGAVNMTDGGRYGMNTYWGRITVDGTFHPSAARDLAREDKAELWAILTAMRDGKAEEVFAAHGHATGECCICGRPLSNQESVALGMGPICRGRAFG